MKQSLLIFQIVISSILILLILIQPKGTGLGRSFGQAASTSFTRRGLNRWVFNFTFLVTSIFVVVSIIVFII